MAKGRTSGPVDGFGDSGLPKANKNFSYPSLELNGIDVEIGKNNRMGRRRIYQLGTWMPCQENDDECKDDEAQGR